MTKNLVVPITRIRNRTPLPRYMTTGAAGMDVHADVQDLTHLTDGKDTVTIPPLGRVLIPTGFSLALPDGYEAQIRPRSGLALRAGLTILNSPGTIDADFRDEVKILVINLGELPIHITHGDRIAQLVVAPVTRVDWLEVEQLPPTSRTGGFGHTGK